MEIKIGDELPNHSTVVAIKNDTVLALTPRGKDPYATWSINMATGDCYSGHYFSNILDAAKDFDRR